MGTGAANGDHASAWQSRRDGPIHWGRGSTMTEWTCDLAMPMAEVDDTGDTQEAGHVAPAAPDSWPYQDLDVDALIEDIQLDLVDWFA